MYYSECKSTCDTTHSLFTSFKKISISTKNKSYTFTQIKLQANAAQFLHHSLFST